MSFFSHKCDELSDPCGCGDEISSLRRALKEKEKQLSEAHHQYEEDIQQLCLEVEEKNARIQELETALLTIGDMAINNWDDKVVGEVDKITYTYKNEYMKFRHSVAEKDAQIKNLEQLLADFLGADIPSSEAVWPPEEGDNSYNPKF